MPHNYVSKRHIDFKLFLDGVELPVENVTIIRPIGTSTLEATIEPDTLVDDFRPRSVVLLFVRDPYATEGDLKEQFRFEWRGEFVGFAERESGVSRSVIIKAVDDQQFVEASPLGMAEVADGIQAPYINGTSFYLPSVTDTESGDKNPVLTALASDFLFPVGEDVQAAEDRPTISSRTTRDIAIARDIRWIPGEEAAAEDNFGYRCLLLLEYMSRFVSPLRLHMLRTELLQRYRTGPDKTLERFLTIKLANQLVVGASSYFGAGGSVMDMMDWLLKHAYYTRVNLGAPETGQIGLRSLGPIQRARADIKATEDTIARLEKIKNTPIEGSSLATTSIRIQSISADIERLEEALENYRERLKTLEQNSFDGSGFSVIHDLALVPNLYYGFPPLCNWIFPEMINDAGTERNHLAQPTRLAMLDSNLAVSGGLRYLAPYRLTEDLLGLQDIVKEGSKDKSQPAQMFGTNLSGSKARPAEGFGYGNYNLLDSMTVEELEKGIIFRTEQSDFDYFSAVSQRYPGLQGLPNVGDSHDILKGEALNYLNNENETNLTTDYIRFIQQMVEFRLLLQKLSRTASISGPYNPWPVVGAPMIIARTNNAVIGLLTGKTDTLNAAGNSSTMYSLDFVRKFEPMLSNAEEDKDLGRKINKEDLKNKRKSLVSEAAGAIHKKLADPTADERTAAKNKRQLTNNQKTIADAQEAIDKEIDYLKKSTKGINWERLMRDMDFNQTSQEAAFNPVFQTRGLVEYPSDGLENDEETQDIIPGLLSLRRILEDYPSTSPYFVPGNYAYSTQGPVVVPQGGGDHLWAFMNPAAIKRYSDALTLARKALFGFSREVARGVSLDLSKEIELFLRFKGIAVDPFLQSGTYKAVVTSAEDLTSTTAQELADKQLQEDIKNIRSKFAVRQGFVIRHTDVSVLSDMIQQSVDSIENLGIKSVNARDERTLKAKTEINAKRPPLESDRPRSRKSTPLSDATEKTRDSKTGTNSPNNAAISAGITSTLSDRFLTAAIKIASGTVDGGRVDSQPNALIYRADKGLPVGDLLKRAYVVAGSADDDSFDFDLENSSPYVLDDDGNPVKGDNGDYVFVDTSSLDAAYRYQYEKLVYEAGQRYKKILDANRESGIRELQVMPSQEMVSHILKIVDDMKLYNSLRTQVVHAPSDLGGIYSVVYDNYIRIFRQFLHRVQYSSVTGDFTGRYPYKEPLLSESALVTITQSAGTKVDVLDGFKVPLEEYPKLPGLFTYYLLMSLFPRFIVLQFALIEFALKTAKKLLAEIGSVSNEVIALANDLTTIDSESDGAFMESVISGGRGVVPVFPSGDYRYVDVSQMDGAYASIFGSQENYSYAQISEDSGSLAPEDSAKLLGRITAFAKAVDPGNATRVQRGILTHLFTRFSDLARKLFPFVEKEESDTLYKSWLESGDSHEEIDFYTRRTQTTMAEFMRVHGLVLKTVQGGKGREQHSFLVMVSNSRVSEEGGEVKEVVSKAVFSKLYMGRAASETDAGFAEDAFKRAKDDGRARARKFLTEKTRQRIVIEYTKRHIGPAPIKGR